jgi:hypothetical protein
MMNTNKSDIIMALTVAENIWSSRANGITILGKCPVCRVMEKSGTDDPCLKCPISQQNDSCGCPDLVQSYKESTSDQERQFIALGMANFIAESRKSYCGEQNENS